MREYDVLYTGQVLGPVRARELTKHVLLSQPALSRPVDRLADRGLVAREPDPADRRGAGSRSPTTAAPRNAASAADTPSMSPRSSDPGSPPTS